MKEIAETLAMHMRELTRDQRIRLALRTSVGNYDGGILARITFAVRPFASKAGAI